MTLRPISAALRACVLILCAAALCALAGCGTTDSDMPWGRPEPWEGSPTIPGMQQ
jgi:hypothetical protein